MKPESSAVRVDTVEASSRQPAEGARAHLAPARPAARSPASAPLRWIIAISAGAVAVLADPLVRAGLPTILHPVWPLLTFGCGLLLSRRFGQNRRAAESAASPAASRVDRAAAELNLLAIDRSAAETLGPAGGRGHDNVAVLSPVKVRYLGVERAVQDLGQYETFTAIVAKQTRSIADLGAEAAATILTGLQGIADKVGVLLTSIGRSRASEQVARAAERIEADLADCRSLLTAFVVGQQNNASESLRQRSQLVIDTKSVLDVLDGVKRVAQQTTILSLNVSIEAARVGEAGRGFTVIATEIRKLSAEVQALSSDVHARVKALMQTVTVDMQGQARQREERDHVAIARIAETLDGLTEHFTAFVAHQNDVLQKVETDGMAIARPIADLAANITFQEIIGQQIDQLNGMAEMVGDHINNLASMLADDDLEMENETLSAKLDSLASAQSRFARA